MNTETNNAAIPSLAMPSAMGTPLVRQAAVLAGQSLFGLVKFLMVSAPFLSMVMMILALWGVAGKASYPDLEAMRQAKPATAGDAKNYLVNETKTIEQCPETLETPDTDSEAEQPMPGKIDWAHVV